MCGQKSWHNLDCKEGQAAEMPVRCNVSEKLSNNCKDRISLFSLLLSFGVQDCQAPFAACSVSRSGEAALSPFVVTASKEKGILGALNLATRMFLELPLG